MKSVNIVRLLGVTSALASIPAMLAVAAHAQTTPTAPTSPPPGNAIEVPPEIPAPGSPSAAPEMTPVQSDATAPSTPDTAAPAPTAAAPAPVGPTASEVAVGSDVFGSDGQKLGEIEGVKAGSDGAISEVHMKTGGFFGFFEKTVVVPGSKVTKGGQTVQVAMTSDEADELPVLTESNS